MIHLILDSGSSTTVVCNSGHWLAFVDKSSPGAVRRQWAQRASDFALPQCSQTHSHVAHLQVPDTIAMCCRHEVLWAMPRQRAGSPEDPRLRQDARPQCHRRQVATPADLREPQARSPGALDGHQGPCQRLLSLCRRYNRATGEIGTGVLLLPSYVYSMPKYYVSCTK